MNQSTFPSQRTRAPRCTALVLMLLLFVQGTAAAGISKTPVACMTQDRAPAAAMFAQGWTIGRLWDFVEHALGERRRMIQFATIGLIVGLFILMKK